MYNKEMENKKRISLQKVCLLFIVSMLIYFILSIFVSVMLNAMLKDGESIEKYYTTNWYVILSYGVFPLSFIISALIFANKDKTLLKEFLPEKNFNILYLPLCILLCFSIIFGLSELNGYFIDFLGEKFGYVADKVYLPKKSFWGIVCAVFAVAILPAICEELMFRRFILGAMQDLPSWFTVITGGLLFALFHLNPAQTPYQFVFGCVFVMVALITKSVYFTMIMHFLNNITILLIYYAGWSASFSLAITIIALIIFTIIVAFLVYKLAKNKSERLPIKNGLSIFIPILLCFIIWLGGF